MFKEIYQQFKRGFILEKIGKGFRRYFHFQDPLKKKLITDDLDPTDNFDTSSDDGFLQSYYYDTYNAAWTAASAQNVRDTYTYSRIGQLNNGTQYAIMRGGLFFDTSTLGSDATITAASVHIKNTGVVPDVHFDLTVQNGQPTYPHEPMVVGDYDKGHYSGNGGSINTNWGGSGWKELTLNSTGRGWINKTGTTKLCLRSSKDISGTAPGLNEDNRCEIYTYEEGTNNIPYLEVTYILGGSSDLSSSFVVQKTKTQDLSSTFFLQRIAELSSTFDVRLFYIIDVTCNPASVQRSGTNTTELRCDWHDSADLAAGAYTCQFWTRGPPPDNDIYGPFTGSNTKEGSKEYNSTYDWDPPDGADLGMYDLKATVSK